MKNTFLLFPAIALMLIFMGCGDSAKTAKTGEAETVSTETGNTFTVDTEATTLKWVGSKLAYSHNGTINVQSGKVQVKDGTIVSGNFVVDMNSISDADLTDPEKNAKLVTHLKSNDFFNASSFPVATFEITKVQAFPAGSTDEGTHYISGNMTIRNITKEITFAATVDVSDDKLTAKSNFGIDRSQWEVKYGSESFFDLVKDEVISNIIFLDLNLVAKAG